MRGATKCAMIRHGHSMNFNPRSSCEERRLGDMVVQPGQHFNPRSSCEERRYRFDAYFDTAQFQSTLLMRGATWILHLRIVRREISIHAPHARSDAAWMSYVRLLGNFNPRSSCEERPPRGGRALCQEHNFNPRSSCEERPYSWKQDWERTTNFNPRSSCEERLEDV